MQANESAGPAAGVRWDLSDLYTAVDDPALEADLTRALAEAEEFERSYRGLRMNPPLSLEEIREILFECVRRSGLRDAYVDMIATRGAATAATRLWICRW